MRIPLVALVLLVVAVGCSKNPPEDQSTESATTPTANDAAFVDAATAYETLRAALAQDDLEKSKLAASAAAKAARASLPKAGTQKANLEAMAQAADAIAAAPDLTAQRREFGELSRHLISLMVAVPSLQKSRFVFSCPMAKGYKKWVQVKKKMENPYMGQEMLECGSESEWKV